MGDFIEVKGLRELDRKLAELEEVAGKKVLRGAMFDAMLPVHRAARQNAQAINDSGALAAAMGRWFTQFGLRTFAMFVGPRRRAAKAIQLWTQRHGAPPKGGIRHGHLQEFGTVDHNAQPFLRPAFDANKQAMISIFVRRLRERIEKVARR